MHKYFLMLILTMLAFSQTSTTFAATAITGTITEKRGDAVKVEFQPHETAGPAVGDKVEFSTLLQGLKVGAGTGVVTEVYGEAVWVKINDNRPNLKMIGIIQATGAPSAVSKGQRDVNIEYEKAPLKKTHQAQDSSEESMSQQDLEKAVIRELIRLRYIAPEMDGNVSADMLQASVDMCGIYRGFSSGRRINGELLNFLRKLEP